MKIIVGLGNPGQQYALTRHNVGFRFVGMIAHKQGLRFDAAPRFRAEIADWRKDGQRVILVRPQTFMNHSGEAVAPLARYHDVDAADILVVYDDIDLLPGQFRLRRGGGHGGHNGLKSLDQHLPNSNYLRLRIGIGRPPHGEVTPWVLGRMSEDELAREALLFEAIFSEIDDILAGDIARAANNIHLRLAPAKE